MSNCRPREPGCQGSGGASEGFCMGLQSDTKASAFQGSTKKALGSFGYNRTPACGMGVRVFGFRGKKEPLQTDEWENRRRYEELG